jgi:hypothetical protein
MLENSVLQHTKYKVIRLRLFAKIIVAYSEKSLNLIYSVTERLVILLLKRGSMLNGSLVAVWRVSTLRMQEMTHRFRG